MNRIIALWCVPRSRSTAMERVFYDFQDLKIVHEPFLYLYYVAEKRRELPDFEPDSKHPRSYEDLRDWIRSEAQEKTVFLKDMSYYVVDHLARDANFFGSMTNTFLIRDPAETISSYYKIDPEVTLTEIGHESVYRHAMFVAEQTGERPIVVDAGDLVDNSAGTIRAYCQAISVSFEPGPLEWGTAIPREWQTADGWHTDVKETRGIEKTGDPSTADLRILRDNPNLKSYEDHHRKFHEKLLEFRLPPIPSVDGNDR